MIAIIVGLIIVLIIIVVVVNSIQQHKEKVEADKRSKVNVQKSVIDSTEELLLNLSHLPPNPVIIEILNRRSLNAAKLMKQTMPELKGIKSRVQELESRLEASRASSTAFSQSDEAFLLPENEQTLVTILQTIKKLRATIKSEQTKGALDSQVYMQEDLKLDILQLKINIESLIKRGNLAYSKEMLGSARQYYEKAMQTLSSHSSNSEYVRAQKENVENRLEDITNQLKNVNAIDAEKKAKKDENELDVLFQPKKKW